MSHWFYAIFFAVTVALAAPAPAHAASPAVEQCNDTNKKAKQTCDDNHDDAVNGSAGDFSKQLASCGSGQDGSIFSQCAKKIVSSAQAAIPKYSGALQVCHKQLKTCHDVCDPQKATNVADQKQIDDKRQDCLKDIRKQESDLDSKMANAQKAIGQAGATENAGQTDPNNQQQQAQQQPQAQQPQSGGGGQQSPQSQQQQPQSQPQSQASSASSCAAGSDPSAVQCRVQNLQASFCQATGHGACPGCGSSSSSTNASSANCSGDPATQFNTNAVPESAALPASPGPAAAPALATGNAGGGGGGGSMSASGYIPAGLGVKNKTANSAGSPFSKLAQMSLRTGGGGGGGGSGLSSDSSADFVDPFHSAAQRSVASTPAAGTNAASSDVEGLYGPSVVSILSGVYQERCESGKFLHCPLSSK